jgi:hypothetical protein
MLSGKLAWMPAELERRPAMDRLLQVDCAAYVRAMRVEVDQILSQVMDAVNTAPDGNVINGSEMQVRDLMAELRRRAFEKAMQMRIDFTESSFSPSADGQRPEEAEQRPGRPKQFERQREN